MKKTTIYTLIVAFVFALSASFAFAAVNSVTPSTNDINRTNGWAHVDQLSKGVGTTDLKFISTRGLYSCFEYRTDGDTGQKIGANNYNSGVADGLYPYTCRFNNDLTKTITASEYVEVRMVFGGETDERFDWTRFDVIPPITTPQITGFLNPALSCGAITNIHSTTVDWTNSTGGVGGVVGYEYAIDYPLVGGGVGHWTTFLTPSQRSGSLNEGLHTIKVRAKDGAGNYSNWSNECTITADWTAPDVEITNPADGSTVSGTVDIRGSVTDINLLRYYFVIENSVGTKVAGPGTVNEDDSFVDQTLLLWNTTLVADGTYKIKLEARDKATNKDPGSSDWHTVIVDNDSDNDGVPNGADNCPEVSNQDQLNSDDDNLGDACDGNDDNDSVLDEDDCQPLDASVVVLKNSKACALWTSGVSGRGILTAPGLQKEFNPKSKAEENAGKKN